MLFLAPTLLNVLNNTTNTKQRVIYTITPWIRDVNGNKDCNTGVPVNIDVWVEPTVKVNVSPKSDTICNNARVLISLTSPSLPTREVRFKYAPKPPAGVIVNSGTVSNLVPSFEIRDSIINNNDYFVIVPFIVTPYTREASTDIEKCAGINDTVYIYVEPTAKVIFSAASDTICNSSRINISLTTITNATVGVRFRYETTIPAGSNVTIDKGPTTDISHNTILTDSLNNPNDTYQIVKYRIIPYTLDCNLNEKCVGKVDSFYVYLLPTLKATYIVSTFIGGRNISCFGKNDGRINLGNLVGGFVSMGQPINGCKFVWSNNKTTSNNLNIPRGTYSVNITDKQNCKTSQTFTLTEPDKIV